MSRRPKKSRGTLAGILTSESEEGVTMAKMWTNGFIDMSNTNIDPISLTLFDGVNIESTILEELTPLSQRKITDVRVARALYLEFDKQMSNTIAIERITPVLCKSSMFALLVRNAKKRSIELADDLIVQRMCFEGSGHHTYTSEIGNLVDVFEESYRLPGDTTVYLITNDRCFSEFCAGSPISIYKHNVYTNLFYIQVCMCEEPNECYHDDCRPAQRKIWLQADEEHNTTTPTIQMQSSIFARSKSIGDMKKITGKINHHKPMISSPFSRERSHSTNMPSKNQLTTTAQTTIEKPRAKSDTYTGGMVEINIHYDDEQKEPQETQTVSREKKKSRSGSILAKWKREK